MRCIAMLCVMCERLRQTCFGAKEKLLLNQHCMNCFCKSEEEIPVSKIFNVTMISGEKLS
jgi:hypothetical protein